MIGIEAVLRAGERRKNYEISELGVTRLRLVIPHSISRSRRLISIFLLPLSRSLIGDSR
jgi:hypothetical protein